MKHRLNVRKLSGCLPLFLLPALWTDGCHAPAVVGEHEQPAVSTYPADAETLAARKAIVGFWKRIDGHRPNGQIQFMADIYFEEMEFFPDGKVRLKRDWGNIQTVGTWQIEQPGLLTLQYPGGHDGSGRFVSNPQDHWMDIQQAGDELFLEGTRFLYKRIQKQADKR